MAAEAQALLDTVAGTCLVHSDLNPKNLLVDPGTLEVTGVVDWEFAHAGHPFTDLGNLLRFDRDPAFADAVLAAYGARRGGRRPTRPSTWPGRPTCGRWWTSPPGAARTRWPSGPTSCSGGRDAPGPGTWRRA